MSHLSSLSTIKTKHSLFLLIVNTITLPSIQRMTTVGCNHNLDQFNSHENQCFEDEDESLSLCDLPINNHQIETNSKIEQETDLQGDFEFGLGHGAAATRPPEKMCTAEEVFFQGRILPLRHSDSRIITSMSVVSSKTDPRIRNHFHSHPSPSPQIRTQSFRTSNPKTSSLWSFLQVGLVKPQEIGLSDLKNRSKRSGSYSSNSSSTSSSMNSTKDQNMKHHRKNTKKKQRLFLGGCNCSVDSVERTMKEPVPKKKTTKEENMLHARSGEGRIAASRHRTFEWLKQLAPTEA